MSPRKKDVTAAYAFSLELTSVSMLFDFHLAEVFFQFYGMDAEICPVDLSYSS